MFSLVYALHCHVDSGSDHDAFDFGMSSIFVVFGVWILFDMR